MNQPTLDEVIAKYIAAIESHQSPERERFMADHSYLADQLRDFFADYDRMQNIFRVSDENAVEATDDSGNGEDRDENRRILRQMLDLTGTTNDHEAANALGQVEQREYEPRYQPSTMIGPYKLLHAIAVGGMGEVWMAEQESPIRRQVAIKFIRTDSDSKQIVARFEAERQALALMDHPNIARVLDAGTSHDRQPYFVMELVRGRPFIEYCDENQLSIADRLMLFAAVCSAVQHAHQKGIIHRDLKPSNILVALYDGRPVPKVIDFGLAKALQNQPKLTQKTLFTKHGAIVGTLQYMSPEQAELNSLDVDTRTDIYALGVVLYELLTGSTPIDPALFNKRLLYKVLESIREHDPPRPSLRLSTAGDRIAGISRQRRTNPRKLTQLLRGELDWVVMKALEKERSRRYSTANDFSEDIHRFLNGQAVEARPPSRIYRLRKFIGRNRALSVGTAAFVLLLVSSALITGFLAMTANRAKNFAESKTKQVAVQLDLLMAVFSDIDPGHDHIEDAQLRERLGRNLRQTIDKLELLPSIDTYQTLQLYDALQKAFSGLGFPQDALKAAEAAKKIASIESLSQHDWLKVEMNLADALSKVHRFADAISILEKIGPLVDAEFGDEHEFAANSQLTLAYAYSQAGRGPAAIVVYDKIIPILEKNAILESQYIAALHDAGIAYAALGNHAHAIDYQGKGVELCVKTLGEHHSKTIGAKVGMGNTLNDMGRFRDARPLMEQAYASAVREFGEKSSRTATTLSMLLATCGRANGEPDFLARMIELLPLSQGSYEYLKASHGAEHPATISVFGNLATAYGLAGKFDRCVQLFRDHVAQHERFYGSDDERTIAAREKLAIALKETGQYEEAKEILKDAIVFYETKFGKTDGRTISAQSELNYVILQNSKTFLLKILSTGAVP